MKNKFLMLMIIIAVAASKGAAQTGGTFAITQSVISSGGQNSTGGNFGLTGITGQNTAGEPIGGSTFRVYAGFFTPPSFAPTAAGVIIGGRITTASGAGIRNVTVILTDSSGATREIVSGAGGFYSFTDIPAGAAYIISVTAKRYRFAENSQIRTISEDVTDINFVADTDRIVPLPIILTNPND